MLALYRSRPPGGGARGVPDGARGARRGARDRARPAAARAAPGDPASRTRGSTGARQPEPARPPPRAFVGRERELAELVAGLDEALRRPRPAVPARGRAGHRQEPAGGGAGGARARGAARGCSSAAAGRRAARPPTGRGRRRCAPTCARAMRGAARAARRRRAGARAARPRAARALPRSAAAVAARAGRRALPPLRARSPSSCAAPARTARWCSCSTTCTRPTRPRCCCCASSPASSARPACSCSAPTGTSTRCPGEPLTEMLAEVAREPVTRRLSLAGLSEPEVAEYLELTASEIASPRARGRAARADGGQPAVRRRDRAPARGRGRRRVPTRRGCRSRRASAT